MALAIVASMNAVTDVVALTIPFLCFIIDDTNVDMFAFLNAGGQLFVESKTLVD